jgi:hypothetical protein
MASSLAHHHDLDYVAVGKPCPIAIAFFAGRIGRFSKTLMM